MLVRQGHEPSRGHFSGVIASTTGVLAQHCQRLGDDEDNNAFKLKKAWQDAVFGKCDLQVFIDVDNQGSG